MKSVVHGLRRVVMRAATSVANWLRGHPSLARWALKLLPDVPLTITIPEIGPLRIFTRRQRSYWLRHPLTHERFPLAALQALTKPGDVVYDVGANIGLYTRFCISSFHASRVVAFEPMRANRVQLRHNVELGRIGDRVTIFPYALTDVDAVQELQIDDVSSASAALGTVTGNRASEGRRHYGMPPKSEPVECRRLDSVIAADRPPLPDVIKCDIEGAEGLFLAGALQTLREHSPRLVVEVHGAEKAREVYRVLTTSGYACAGRVGPHLAPSGYCRLDASIIEGVRGPYDLHFLLASKSPEDLPNSITPFQP